MKESTSQDKVEVDQERLKQMNALMEQENGREKVEARFGKHALNSPEFRAAERRQQEIVRRRTAQRRKAAEDVMRKQQKAAQARNADVGGMKSSQDGQSTSTQGDKQMSARDRAMQRRQEQKEREARERSAGLSR